MIGPDQILDNGAHFGPITSLFAPHFILFSSFIMRKCTNSYAQSKDNNENEKVATNRLKSALSCGKYISFDFYCGRWHCEFAFQFHSIVTLTEPPAFPTRYALNKCHICLSLRLTKLIRSFFLGVRASRVNLVICTFNAKGSSDSKFNVDFFYHHNSFLSTDSLCYKRWWYYPFFFIRIFWWMQFEFYMQFLVNFIAFFVIFILPLYFYFLLVPLHNIA